MKSVITLAFAAFALCGCKIDISGKAALVDSATKKSDTVTLSMYSKNTRKTCSIDFSLASEAGETLYELNLDAIYTHDDASTFIDSSLDECSKDLPIVVKATNVDRVISREVVTKPVHCFDNPRDRANGTMGELRHIKVTVITVVSDIEGQIIDKASGNIVKTFTATSEPRIKESSSERPNCQ